MVLLKVMLKDTQSNDKMIRNLKNLIYKGRKTSDELDNILFNNLSIISCVHLASPEKYS